MPPSAEHRLDHIVLEEEQILLRIAEMGEDAAERYKDENPIFLRVKDGADKLADLFEASAREHGLKFETGTITVKSMDGADTTGIHTVTQGYEGPDMTGRKVVLVEDIIDTGETIAFLFEHLEQYAPTIIKTIALFAKEERRVVKDLEFDDIGFIVQGFVVGFGLDFDDCYRELKDLWLVLFPPYPEDSE